MPKKEYHEGIVVDNLDPEKRARIKVTCPTIVEGEALGDWIEPIFPFVDSEERAGWFFVPSVNSSIRIEIESEENSEANGIEARWMCTLYPENSVPEEFQENYPERRGFKTKSGHLLMFDDQDETVTIRSSSGSEIHITQSGRIELKPTGSESVFIGDGADQAIMRGDIFKTFWNTIFEYITTHIHATPSGPTTAITPTGGSFVGPKTPYEFPSNGLSDNHKVK
jgi:hypothetical protein